jgi:hypothetical protein
MPKRAVLSHIYFLIERTFEFSTRNITKLLLKFKKKYMPV